MFPRRSAAATHHSAAVRIAQPASSLNNTRRSEQMADAPNNYNTFQHQSAGYKNGGQEMMGSAQTGSCAPTHPTWQSHHTQL